MKKIAELKMRRIQFLFISLVWILLLTLPLLFVETWTLQTWDHIFTIWSEYAIVFALFLLNRFLLIPYLFFKGHRARYFCAIITCLLLVSYALYFSNKDDEFPAPSPIHGQQGLDRRSSLPPPIHGQRRPDRPSHTPPSIHDQTGDEDFSPPRGFHDMNDMVPPYANILIISILLLGFDSGLMFMAKWVESEQKKLKMEKENVENKMAFLQNQISPHFFMNTLNNIHALIDISSDEAKAAVIKLSHMMNYMLYESQSDKIDIKQELDFIKSYVELMRLRFTDDIEIELDIPAILPQISVPPLLTISFIENAFKHGVSYEHPSFIKIVYRFTETNLYFETSNTNHPKVSKSGHSGIGIVNAEKRLDLIYHDDCDLSMGLKNDLFEVKLNLPI